MSKIRYDMGLFRWFAEDGNPVQFVLEDHAFKLLRVPGETLEIVIRFSAGDVLLRTFHDPESFLLSDSHGNVIREFEIDKRHPFHDYFKKEMIRNGVTHLKVLDAPIDFQEY